MKAKRFINIPAIEKTYRIDPNGQIYSLRKNKFLKPTFNTAGYLYVYILIDGDPEASRFYAVHRLVATKYIGQCPENMETSHKDGNRINNNDNNLEYLTHSQNILKSFREHGRSIQCFRYAHKPASDATKELMSNAKKKAVVHLFNGIETLYPSIDDAAKGLNTYRKKIYTSIYTNKEFKDKHNPSIGGFLAFFTPNCPI